MEVAGTAPARPRFAIPPSRSAADVEYHYRVEIELAQRLRSAPRDERLGLYGRVYDELFRRVPNHPQLTRKVSEEERRKGVADRMATLQPFIDGDTVFLEIGAGDGSLTLAVAQRARHCYALDVSREILSGVTSNVTALRIRHKPFDFCCSEFTKCNEEERTEQTEKH